MRWAHPPIVALLLVAASIVACAPDQWSGVVYKDRSNLTNFERVGVFESMEQCRRAALTKLRELHPESSDPLRVGDYECGLNCKGAVCEETKR